MKLTITMNLDNAAFRYEEEPDADYRDGCAVAEILRNLEARYDGTNLYPGMSVRIMDPNGNAVGTLTIADDAEGEQEQS